MSAEAATLRIPLRFQVGARTLARVHRRLVQVPVPLEDALAGGELVLPGLPDAADGYFLRAVPEVFVERTERQGMRGFVRSSYPRHFASLEQDFDTYLASFSAKSRSSLKRKRRKLEERSGGALDVRLYRTAGEIEEFYRHARAVSALTYQERLLEAGLPDGALGEMREQAARDQARGWLLFVDGSPVSYLYAPGRADSLLYAHLGYDPAFSDLSPGTVLQLEAMRMLMEEQSFRWFDFTEGDGQHKRLFATGSIASVDLLLLRPRLSNFAAVRALAAFDGGVALGKRLVARAGLQRIARAATR
jgi:CelD/BcsL family acetyltransferase involved in cellulose biosynthesis